jgi:hypothetical protein
MPLAPDVIEIKPELLAALHPHPDEVLTFAVPGPPLPPKDWLDGDSE